MANQKGGVGKTTTAVNLGAALAELGREVLVVDLDPQGNASAGLGVRAAGGDPTIYDVLVEEVPFEQAVVPTALEHLHVAPSVIDLAGAEIELVSRFSRELRLSRALESVRLGPYEFVLLDCPPSLGLLTVNALAAADELIVPVQCEYYALEGLGQLLRNVRLVQQNVNPGLRLTGLVLTMFDARTKLAEQVAAEVKGYFGDLVYDTIIPRTVRLSEAPSYGQPITVYDPASRGASTYRELAREVAEREAVEGIPIPERLPTSLKKVEPPPPKREPPPPPASEPEGEVAPRPSARPRPAASTVLGEIESERAPAQKAPAAAEPVARDADARPLSPPPEPPEAEERAKPEFEFTLPEDEIPDPDTQPPVIVVDADFEPEPRARSEAPRQREGRRRWRLFRRSEE